MVTGDLEFFAAGDQGDLALFPGLQRRSAPPGYLRRKPRPRLALEPRPPCPNCGGVVGPLTGICARCFFAGWWSPGCIPPPYEPPCWVVEAAEARVGAARAAGEAWAALL